MSPGIFNRIGNSTIVIAKKYNSENRFLISDFSLVKILSHNSRREAFLINIRLNVNEQLYNFTINLLEDSFLQNKKNLFNPKFATTEESQLVLNSAEIFFQKLAEWLNDANDMFYTQLNSREKGWKKELLGEFLALSNFEVKRWLKSSVIIDDDEDNPKEKVEYPSFKGFFYSENIDDLNAFDRMERVSEIYTKLKPRIENLINDHKSKESEKMKNPKEKSFGSKNSRVKTNKRKTEYLGQLGIVPEDDPNLALAFENNKSSKIQSIELESKLKGDYWPHKKRPPKVMVAPSTIHRYGLFAIEK
jgi:hypothetical protein